MMRRRAAIGLLAGVLLAGLIAVPGAPAGAQDIADLPRLGYEVSPTQGFVGDEMHSQVNPDDVREHCWEYSGVPAPGTLEQLILQYLDGEISDEDLFGSFYVELATYGDPGTAVMVLAFAAQNAGVTSQEQFDDLIEAWAAFYDVPGPISLFDLPTGPIAEFLDDAASLQRPEAIPEDGSPGPISGNGFVTAARNAVRTTVASVGVETLATELYGGAHITTFVDPVTQELLGEMGNFDPATGEGTMLVPDLDPGLYAVAAACAFFPYEPGGFPNPDVEAFAAGYQDGLVAAWEWSVACHEEGGDNCFPTGTTAGGWQDWAAEGGLAAIIGQIVEPRAIGIDFYCILQPDGFCATPPGPVGLITDDVLDEFNGDDPLAPGPGAEGLDDHDDAGDLVAVDATPSFTG